MPLPATALARVRYGDRLCASDDPRDISLSMNPAAGSSRSELWLSSTPVSVGIAEGLRFAHNGEVLMGSIAFPFVGDAELRAVVCDAYRSIYRLLQQEGYPCPLRMWNYLGGINTGQGDDERYRQFSSGRFEALAAQPGFEGHLPAATAVGLAGEGLQIRFLAARTAGTQVENPRQLSAFRYPRQYGPRSPSFSRATLKRWTAETHLYVSGTASIVGHETMHVGNAPAQLEETLNNIDALLAEASHQHQGGGAARPQLIKLYVRKAVDREALLARLRQRFGAEATLYCLQADICRRDLLLEIEGIFHFGA